MILPLMSRHAAGFHPLSYAVWYEYLAGTNPGLKSAIDARVASGRPLQDADIAKLFDEFVALRDIEASARVRAHVQEIIDKVGGATQEVRSNVEQFDAGLSTAQQKLDEPTPNRELLTDVVTSLIGDTVLMRGRTQNFQEYLHNKSQEVVRLREELEVVQGLALTDPLTGLLNRRAFDQEVERRCVTGGGRSCSVLMADIDHFKAINDTHGHLFGDKVLSAVAQVLKSCLAGRGIAARVGGEEFAMLLPGMSIAGAVELAETVRATVERGRIRRGTQDEHTGSVTISLGVAVHQANEAIEALLARADRALYDSKERGRNRVTVAAVPA
ncbi:MAG: GGDEF domain-containing protein [Steroidobacteraceae bacterium]